MLGEIKIILSKRRKKEILKGSEMMNGRKNGIGKIMYFPSPTNSACWVE